jgi:UDP:flavonoid glycosyltransferase YjiC (YdhE family)
MRVLFSCAAAYGHFRPLIPLARAFEAAGHVVAFATSGTFLARVEAAGFSLLPAGVSEHEVDTRMAPYRERLSALPPAERRPLNFTWRFATIEAPAKLGPLQAVATAWEPDLLVHDAADLCGPLVARLLELPVVHHGFGRVIPTPSLELAAAETESLWRSVGLEPEPLGGSFRGLYLDICPPSLQTDTFPEGTHTLAMRPTHPPDAEETLPSWVLGLPERPILYVTLGTVFNDLSAFGELLEALAEVDCSVVATIGRGSDREALGPVPGNARVEEYIPQSLLLPHCDAMVSHGGSGSVLAALAEGIPLVLVPRGADQFDNAARCRELGVGKVLMPDEITGAAVRHAVVEILERGSYQDRAQALAAEIAGMPSPEERVADIVAWAATAPR